MPLDHLSARLQHLDANENYALKELVADKGGLWDAQQRYWCLLNEWHADTDSCKITVLLDHLVSVANPLLTRQEIWDGLRGHSLTVASAS